MARGRRHHPRRSQSNVLLETDMEYFGRDGDRMQMMFNFQVNQHLFYALASADAHSDAWHFWCGAIESVGAFRIAFILCGTDEAGGNYFSRVR